MRWLIIDARRRSRLLLIAAALAAVVLGWTALSGMSGRGSGTLRPLTHGDTGGAAVALTFDVCNGTEQLQTIVAALAQAQVKAAFFVTGRWAAEHPELIKALATAGHSVEASGPDYAPMVGLSADQVGARMASVREALANAGVAEPRFYRPPGGRFDDALLDAVIGAGLIPVTWTVDALDWRLESSAAIVHAATSRATAGAIILLRADDNCPGTAGAIGDICRDLQRRGLRLVGLSELLSSNEDGD